MKLFTGWVISAGLVVCAAGANAQMLAPYEVGHSPYRAVSDVEGPYAAMLPETPAPRYGPSLLPPSEVYTVVRESGFSPLGIPQQRGFVYTISVIDRGGDDGRLVIDARTGRIIRFMPAYRMGDNFNEDLTVTYGPVGPLPPVTNVRGVPRPPRSIPHVASRTPPIPKPSPLAAQPEPAPQQSAVPKVSPLAAEPPQQSAALPKPPPPAVQAEPAQQSAAVQAKPADAPAAPPAVTTGSAPAKPAAPQIGPTQQMPLVQGLE